MSKFTSGEKFCPCCGAEGLGRKLDFTPYSNEYAISCSVCGLITEWVRTLEKARELWEKRV